MKYILLTSTLILGACCIPANEGGPNVWTKDDSSGTVRYVPDGGDGGERPSDDDDDTTDGEGGGGEDDNGDDTDTDTPTKKGNASANNGKGGNYDKTGHRDNGKGNGRNRK